jgi:hypothetical protein
VLPLAAESVHGERQEDAVTPSDPDASGGENAALTYMARPLVLATLPHSRPLLCDATGAVVRDADGHPVEARHWQRVNGRYRLQVQADPDFGLPYGIYPRLTLAWVAHAVKRTRTRVLPLGPLYPWMTGIGLSPGGNTARQVLDQARRLFSCRMAFLWDGEAEDGAVSRRRYLSVARSLELWTPRAGQEWPDRACADTPGVIELTEDFYREVLEFAVPQDLRVVAACRHSALALDLCFWLPYRARTLTRPTAIPWETLERQLGAEYALARQFRDRVRRTLLTVLALYPRLRVEVTREALVVTPARASARGD